MEQNYYLYEIFKSLVDALIPIAICCVLPIFFIRTQARRKMNESKDRTQIVLAALEKNPDMDIKELLKKISNVQPPKTLKEKLLTKLLVGSIFGLLGLALLVFNIAMCYIGGMNSTQLSVFGMGCTVLLGIGAGFLINYYVGRKMLAKEMEAEQKRLTETEKD